jgi:hypothetical protein
MAIFLTVFEGDSPAHARPVLATADPTIIAVVRRLLMERLGDEPTGTLMPLPTRLARTPRKGRSDGPLDSMS